MKQFVLFICAVFLALVTYGQEVIEVNFDAFDGDPIYTPADTTVSRRTGETIITPANWLVKLEHDTYRFSFSFYGDNLVGVYSLQESDFLEDYTFGYDKQVKPYAERINFETCVLTITETHPSATITRYILEASIVATDDLSYLVKATHDILTVVETVEAEILDAQIHPTDYGFVLVADDESNDLDINLSIKWAYGITGYFRNYHVDSVNTVITHHGQTFIPSELEMEVLLVEALSNGQIGYRIPSMQFLSPDVVAYDLKIEAPIVFADTINIACTNLLWDDSQKAESTIFFEASNSTYAISGVLNEKTLKKGVYEGDKVSVEIIETTTGKTITSLKSTITLEGNALKGFSIIGEVLGNDHQVYQITLSKQTNPTAIQDIIATKTVQKTLQSGQLIILKNGVKYNAQGAILK